MAIILFSDVAGCFRDSDVSRYLGLISDPLSVQELPRIVYDFHLGLEQKKTYVGGGDRKPKNLN